MKFEFNWSVVLEEKMFGNADGRTAERLVYYYEITTGFICEGS